MLTLTLFIFKTKQKKNKKTHNCLSYCYRCLIQLDILYTKSKTIESKRCVPYIEIEIIKETKFLCENEKQIFNK